MLTDISMIYPIYLLTFITLGLCISLFIVIRKNRQLASAQQEMIDKLQKRINLQEKSLVSSYLLSLLKGRMTKLGGMEQEPEISFTDGNFALVGCYVPLKAKKPELDELDFFVVDNVFSELMEGELFYRIEDGRFMFYLFCIPKGKEEQWNGKVQKQSEFLCNFLEEKLKMNLTVAISGIEPDISRAKHMYQNVMEALEYQRIADGNGVIHVRDLCESGDSDQFREEELTQVGRPIVRSVKEYIETNYADSCMNLSAIAEALGKNARYLSKVFREETGLGILDYVNRIRIDRATELLAEGNYSVELIGEMVGYASTKTFRRTFAKIVGTTPGNFL